PEHTCDPSPPVAGWRPASTSARPVSTLQAMPAPSSPSARSATTASSGCSWYLFYSGDCRALSSSGLISIEVLQGVIRRDSYREGSNFEGWPRACFQATGATGHVARNEAQDSMLGTPR